MLLPSSCHVMAPRKLPPAAASERAAFSTEFGALLAAGENFGWAGFQGEDADEQQSEAEAEDDSPRLVRITRLYGGLDDFISGTTSLCTAA